MIHFPTLRTKRLTVQLRELSISDSIALAKMPAHLEQATVTAFLKAAVAEANHPDVLAWTVAERMMVVCHYLSAVVEGGPDFAVGENGHFTDYLDGEHDITEIAARFPVGEIEGDQWFVRHLTGYAVESIERIHGELEGISGRLHWLLGSMAMQLIRSNEDLDAAYDDDGLLARMTVMAAYPESDFIALSALYQHGIEQLHHLFHVNFDDDGLLVLPATEGGELPPARFHIRACLSEFAQRVG